MNTKWTGLAVGAALSAFGASGVAAQDLVIF